MFCGTAWGTNEDVIIESSLRLCTGVLVMQSRGNT